MFLEDKNKHSGLAKSLLKVNKLPSVLIPHKIIEKSKVDNFFFL